ncbi:sn-glycerol-1-phosphate dehydrogenase [Anaerobacillus alkaliphilus]|uniref:sn-glycerol-1-phosphate dehydrogenase n=1 Tax=Anaerobacillus alkaliphilus TaxID=1548597 RepID=A0A4Q0VLC1_9BACI|nr:sn-glycerol-1-phosphate dehydrogenase [Anaerobacillus alkaliphilus]RXI96257.1 sn-glycerol-1-phosphate dehydrogenase [Anaerobacillus alkaliphilus]
MLEEVNAWPIPCECGQNHNDVLVEKLVINEGALEEILPFLEQKSMSKILIAVDANTYEVAGQFVVKLLEDTNVTTKLCFLDPNELNDVVADEAAIVQLLLSVDRDIEVVLAVGSGTIHDIVRIVSYKMGKPFISIPTAPSVDGFNSIGAPLVVKGVKTTYKAQAPIAVFADLDIIAKAPKELIAAGFGDMLGKYTSLVDWQFSHLIGGDSFCPVVFQITKDALDACVTNVDGIAVANKSAIKILMHGLIDSGKAMLLIGQSYPASGAEHHLSHYWEMNFLQTKRRQVLHGAKVAVSCQLVADFYHTVVKNILLTIENLPGEDDVIKKVSENQKEILEWIESIPDASQLKELIQKVGGATVPEDLGIEQDLVKESFRNAHLLRERVTLLYFYNEYIRTNDEINVIQE